MDNSDEDLIYCSIAVLLLHENEKLRQTGQAPKAKKRKKNGHAGWGHGSRYGENWAISATQQNATENEI